LLKPSPSLDLARRMKSRGLGHQGRIGFENPREKEEIIQNSKLRERNASPK